MRGVYFAARREYKLESNFTTLCAWVRFLALACNILSYLYFVCAHSISASAAIGRLGGKEKWSFFFCCFIDRGGFVRRKAPTAAQYIYLLLLAFGVSK
jgi:hypothetical protein